MFYKQEGSLAAHLWRFEPGPRARPRRLTWSALRTMAKTEESIALSRDLKKRGWTFVGPTTAYAFMQAMGLVNDHLEGCFVREPAERARARFRRPLSSVAARVRVAAPGGPASGRGSRRPGRRLRAPVRADKVPAYRGEEHG